MPCVSEMNEVPYGQKCHFINIGLTEDWSVLIVHQSTNQIHVNDRCMLKCWHLKGLINGTVYPENKMHF